MRWWVRDCVLVAALVLTAAVAGAVAAVAGLTLSDRREAALAVYGNDTDEMGTIL